MERVTRKIFDYIAEMKRTVTRQRLHKDLKNDYKKENPDVKLMGDKFIGPKDEQ